MIAFSVASFRTIFIGKTPSQVIYNIIFKKGITTLTKIHYLSKIIFVYATFLITGHVQIKPHYRYNAFILL